ncbi:MAG: antibiotic biosynthesis monooxygenase [Alphaproteobacteria bacterium]|nr:MAG: antibiotic biosynthesis monooxygenase [Alphaproteobacteria bacterium]
MIVVIFEVTLDPGQARRYFDLAAELRDELTKIDGFISVERFQSLNDDNRYVSLSFWRDREAVEAWYRHHAHATAQAEGRAGIFRDYRIRVAEVFRDYDMAHGRPQAAGAAQRD